MKNSKNTSVIYLALIVSILFPLQLSANVVLENYKGSTEKGEFKVDFVELDYAKSGDEKPEIKTVEGKLHSRILLKPEDKSTLEVFRSYKKALETSGFTILSALKPKANISKSIITELYNSNGLSKRKYKNTEGQVSSSDLDRIRLFGEYYISAIKQTSTTTLYAFVVLSSQKNLYLIEELTAAKMEEDTVTINLDAMRAAITDTGKIAVYDIYFETGSAEITSQSSHALNTIANYLKQDKNNYYIVGHTDDTGSLENNLTLSEQRADAIAKALMNEFGIKSGRLEARGVGPLSPASNNSSDEGRKMNRRVEIVRRLE